jgi:hypothetical protein
MTVYRRIDQSSDRVCYDTSAAELRRELSGVGPSAILTYAHADDLTRVASEALYRASSRCFLGSASSAAGESP